MYLACETRPDIVFVVGQLSRHNLDPQVGHLCITKQVIKYLRKTITLGIIQGNDLVGHRQKKYGLLGIVSYANSNYAGDRKDKKSIIGYCFSFKKAINIWFSKQQQSVLMSISETEYVAISYRAREEVQIRRFLNKLLLEQAVRKMEMLSNNKTSLILTKDPKSQNQIKYIDVIYHHLQGLVEDGELTIE